MWQLHATKRRFLKEAGLIALFAPAVISRPAFAEETKGIVEKLKEKVTGKGEEKEVTPPEDLMREHGVLDRVLLVYEAGIHKLASKEDFDPALLTQSATIVRDFIHDYHEQSEEHYVFPRFQQANQLTDLVGTLLDQHRAARRVTERVLQLAPNSRTDADARRQVTAQITAFITMYRPHAAREDTDLFRSSANSSRHTHTTRWPRTLRTKSTRNSARMASRRWPRAWPSLNRAWAFTT